MRFPLPVFFSKDGDELLLYLDSVKNDCARGEIKDPGDAADCPF